MRTTANSDGTALASSIWAAQQLMADDDQMLTDQQIEQSLCELAAEFIRSCGAEGGPARPHRRSDRRRRMMGRSASIRARIFADPNDGAIGMEITADYIRVLTVRREPDWHYGSLKAAEWHLAGEAMANDAVDLIAAVVAEWRGGEPVQLLPVFRSR
jgi:hypothetical protein